MPSEITMPQLSDTMTEGTVIKWVKREGEKVKPGDVIAEVETDKANMEMEAFEAGTIAITVAAEGTKVPVGNIIAVLAVGSDDPAAVKGRYAGSSGKPAAAKSATAATGSSSPPKSATATIAPPPQTPSTNGGDHADADRVHASPLARRLARERGIDLAQIKGTGPSGRIIHDDVLAFVDQSAGDSTVAPTAQPSKTAQPLPQRVASGQNQTVQISKWRATIAQRLTQSKQSIPHYYETMDIDVEEVVRVRAMLNQQLEKDGIRLSVGDFIAKAVASALQIHPELNSTLAGDQLTRHGDVNLGMAVALPEGLMVAVLRNIHQMGLREIRRRSADLVERARQQKLRQDELSGGTFTVSNLGPFGIRQFTAIINPPEVAILAIGAAEKRAVVINDQLAARTMLSVCLSSDHRVVDGAVAAEFLQTLRDLLQEPALMLL